MLKKFWVQVCRAINARNYCGLCSMDRGWSGTNVSHACLTPPLPNIFTIQVTKICLKHSTNAVCSKLFYISLLYILNCTICNTDLIRKRAELCVQMCVKIFIAYILQLFVNLCVFVRSDPGTLNFRTLLNALHLGKKRTVVLILIES